MTICCVFCKTGNEFGSLQGLASHRRNCEQYRLLNNMGPVPDNFGDSRAWARGLKVGQNASYDKFHKLGRKAVLDKYGTLAGPIINWNNSPNKSKPYGLNWIEYCSRKIMMRSSWEIGLAEFLDQIPIDWSYEQLRIPYTHPEYNVVKLYYPDFYIESINLIIEVKPSVFINELAEVKRRAAESLGYNFQYFTEKMFTIETVTSLISQYTSK